jgi:hypothetical protein
MNNHRITKQLLSLVIASSSLIVAADASAAPLPCVQRAINWNNASPNNRVTVTMVAMNDVGNTAYAVGDLVNSGCNLAPLSLTGCMASSSSMNGLIDSRVSYPHPIPGDDGSFGSSGPAQPFSIDEPLPLTVDTLRANNAFVTRFRSAYGAYDMTTQCVGNLMTGNDQYGYHWTVSFQLYTQPVIH